jgi:hypothetical protein
VKAFSERPDLGRGSSLGNVNIVSSTTSSARLPGLDVRTLWNDSLINISDSQPKASRVDVAMTKEEQGSKDRLGNKVENTVEDSLGIRRDKIATLANTPGNWVKNPDDSRQGTTHEEYSTNIRTNMVGVNSSFPGELIDDIDQGDATLAAC